MENEIKVEFNAKFDKNIYEATRWNTIEGFFNQLVVTYIADDVNFIARQVEQIKPDERKGLVNLVKTLREINENIRKSIKYETLNTINNIEEVKISFNFKYYESPEYSPGLIVNNLIFDKTINSNNFLAEDIVRVGKGVGATQENIDLAVKMYTHVGDLMNNAKPSLVVSQNGVALDLSPTKRKLKK